MRTTCKACGRPLFARAFDGASLAYEPVCAVCLPWARRVAARIFARWRAR